MKIVAVTACPTGIAHTYMAAKQLLRVARQFGYTIKVETQGATGIENELTQEEVDAADMVIIASDILIERAERFENVRNKMQLPMQMTLKNPEAIFARLK
jgi:fructose-specific phosphotransferase system IIB component